MSTNGPGWSPSLCWNTNWLHRWLELLNTNKERRVDGNIVATPLWDKCEDETHTPKSGKLESSGTPENSKLDCRGQISSHSSVLYVIGKVLECRCHKWPRMSHV